MDIQMQIKLIRTEGMVNLKGIANILRIPHNLYREWERPKYRRLHRQPRLAAPYLLTIQPEIIKLYAKIMN